MEEGEWTENGTKLEITVKLTDSEDPPILKVSFLLTILSFSFHFFLRFGQLSYENIM